MLWKNKLLLKPFASEYPEKTVRKLVDRV